MPPFITDIIGLNVSGNIINCPQPGRYKAMCGIKWETFVIVQKQSQSTAACCQYTRRLSGLIIQAFVCFLINCIYLGIQRLI